MYKKCSDRPTRTPVTQVKSKSKDNFILNSPPLILNSRKRKYSIHNSLLRMQLRVPADSL